MRVQQDAVAISIQFASSINHGFIAIRPWHHSHVLVADTRDTWPTALFVADSQMRRQLSFFNFKATHHGFIVD
jgi:hypothetical protein